MPWLALPYGAAGRDAALRALGLHGVMALPELIVLDARTGEKLIADGVGALRRGLLMRECGDGGALVLCAFQRRCPPCSGIVPELARGLPPRCHRASAGVRVQRHDVTSRPTAPWWDAGRRGNSAESGARAVRDETRCSMRPPRPQRTNLV
jgi:hypothetical protein